MRRLWAAGAAIVMCLALGGMPVAGQPAEPSDLRLTLLYDNTSTRPELIANPGFSALVDYGSHTLLFDTGFSGSVLLDNMQQLGVDPDAIEAVILSHEHDDHIGGLQALLDAGVRPIVYVPAEFTDAFKESVRNQTELVEVAGAVEVIPGVHTTGPTGANREQALVVETGDGAVLITGCAHPGAAAMVRQAQTVTNSRIAYLVGGLHLFETPVFDPVVDVPPLITELRELGIDSILPAHCTGDVAIDLIHTAYGENFTAGGVGRTLTIEAR